MLQFFKGKPLKWLYVAGGLLLVAAAAVWCCKVNLEPEHVFWKTIERGLASNGVTIETEQTNEGTTAKQVIQFSLGASNLAHSYTTLTQAGTTVKNEMIGTPTTDYSRYLSVKTDQKKSDGSPIDFSKVLNIWAEGKEGTGQFFTQALFGGSLPIGGMGVPIGNVSSDARASLMRQVHSDHVYNVAFDKVKKERINGRLRYTYDVSVQPVAYVALMKHFAQAIGIHGLDQLDPNQYEGQAAFKLQIVVDAKAQQIVRISAPETGGSQTYSSHDVPVQVQIPKKAISGPELQKLLSELQ